MTEAHGHIVPFPYVVTRNVAEAPDTATLSMVPVDRGIDAPVPGQFTMLSLFGMGEVPISVSGLPLDDEPLRHTIRSAGALTTALARLDEGDVVGVRGPFGTAWPLPDGDVVVVAGGIGVAPLLPAIRSLDRADRPGRLSVLVGARRPSGLLARDELAEVGRRHHVAHTVDSADPSWADEVGVVTELLRRVPFPLQTASALVCGPEVMMRFTARGLEEQGMPADAVHVSLERNMHCGRGACGHCQLGPFLLCTDGPVVRWSSVDPVLAVRNR